MIVLKLQKPENTILGFEEIKMLEQRVYYFSEFKGDDGKKKVCCYYEWVCIADGCFTVIDEKDIVSEVAREVYIHEGSV